MFKALFGDPNDRKLKKFQPYITEVKLYEEDLQDLSDDDLAAKTTEFREKLTQAESREEEDEILDEILPEAFAVVRETSRRVLGMRHFDVKIIGGTILHTGEIAEMKTEEGKTLVATLPCYLNTLAGRGVHVVTVND